MTIRYADCEAARARDGLRMVVVPRVPSPWGEAAKGILHLKRIPWLAVRLDQANAEMAAWTGQRSGPVAMWNAEPPRGGWAEILLLAERIAPDPALLPAKPSDRALVMGLSHEICGEMGLGWSRRLAGVHSGLNGQGGFPEGIARYLGDKYGYRAEEGEVYARRVIDVLEMLAARLQVQREAGRHFYVGQELSAVDVYSATFMALFRPLPHDQCPMPEAMRAAFETIDAATEKALDPILIEHRDRVYAEYLELPLSL